MHIPTTVRQSGNPFRFDLQVDLARLEPEPGLKLWLFGENCPHLMPGIAGE